MTEIVHLSDLHFGRVNTDVARALLDELRTAPPDLIVISGDLTQHARTAEFEAARAFLDRLPGPVLVVPGNHDLAGFNLVERFLYPWQRYRRWITDDLSPSWDNGAVVVVGVNTARRLGLSWNWADGRISRWQVDLVEQALAQRPAARWRIVVAHHPFVRAPARTVHRITRRSDMAVARFLDAGVDLILAGHLHRAFLGRAITANGDGAPITVVQASTATSNRTRNEPNAYNRVRLDDDHALISTRVWRQDAFEDGPVHRVARRGR